MITLHKKYKELAYLIIQKAKKLKVMKKYDYEHIVKPYLTILRINPITEKEVLEGFRNSRIKII